jgi:hypothetical protein
MLLPPLLGCPPKEPTLSRPTVTQVLERHTASLMSVVGVVGTAEGECAGQPCILVLVERATPALRQAIPSQLDGIPVEVRETGRIEAH